MPSHFFVRVLGSVMQLDFADELPADLRSEVEKQWDHLRVDLGADGAAPAARFLLAPVGATTGEEAEVTVVSAPDDAAPDRLATALTLAGLRALAGEALMLHAAGLATDRGDVVALVGPSGRGKTTACRHLGSQFGYVTDETVALRADRRVIPYPKPLSIGVRPGVKQLVAPQDAGMKPAPEELRLAALVLLDRDADALQGGVTPVPVTEALGELVSQTSSLARLPRPLQTLLGIMAETGGVRRLRYADGADLVALMPAVLTTTGAVPEWTPAAPGPVRHDAPAGTIVRTEFADAVWIGETLAVLTEGRLHVLEGIGPRLWESADGVSLAELADAVVSGHGEAPHGVDAAASVADAVDQLVEAGVLRRM